MAQHEPVTTAMPANNDGREALLDELAASIRVCTKCVLCEGRTQAVPGEGNPRAQVMFIGEAPGEREDRDEQEHRRIHISP